MVVDLLLLGGLGFALEALTQRFGYIVIPCSPFSYFSLLIMFMAVTRWNLFGLILAPLLAFATILGGMFVEANDVAAVYNWQAYLSIFAGLLAFGINVVFYKKNTTKIISSIPKVVGLIFLDYLLFNLIQLIVYRLLTFNGDPFHQGIREVINNGTGEVVNVIAYGERGLVYNLFALAVLTVGVFIFRSQGVLCNVKQKLIDDKRNAELDKLDENFTIEEVANESENSTDLDNSTKKVEGEVPESTKPEGDETPDDVEAKPSSED